MDFLSSNTNIWFCHQCFFTFFTQGGRASPLGGKNSPENIPPTITEVDADEHSYLGGGAGRGRLGSNRGAITAARGGRAEVRTRRISEGEKDQAMKGL